MPGLAIDLTYAWLDTELKSKSALDFMNRTQGDPDVVQLKAFDGQQAFFNYIAPTDDVLPLVNQAIVSGAALPFPGSIHANGIPTFFSRDFLEANGVATAEGNLTDLGDNELPYSPPHSVTLGAAQTWPLAWGALTLRYDYYWQDASYSREFNTRGDEIDSWDQHNASLIFETTDGRWSARAWIRNFTDEENVTGHFLISDSSGNFRNYFLTEPRIYGASLRYTFGDIH
jgi:outer membrane receptor protein involved in Fe transport